MRRTTLLLSFVVVIGVLSVANAQKEKPSADWPAYGRDAGGSRFSPLAQINRGNVAQLKTAWTYRTGAEEVKAASARNAVPEVSPMVGRRRFTTISHAAMAACKRASGSTRPMNSTRLSRHRSAIKVFKP